MCLERKKQMLLLSLHLYYFVCVLWTNASHSSTPKESCHLLTTEGNIEVSAASSVCTSSNAATCAGWDSQKSSSIRAEEPAGVARPSIKRGKIVVKTSATDWRQTLKSFVQVSLPWYGKPSLKAVVGEVSEVVPSGMQMEKGTKCKYREKGLPCVSLTHLPDLLLQWQSHHDSSYYSTMRNCKETPQLKIHMISSPPNWEQNTYREMGFCINTMVNLVKGQDQYYIGSVVFSSIPVLPFYFSHQ